MTTTTQSASGAAGPSSTGISLPPRPKNLSVFGIEPCKLLTAQQQAQLNINRATPRRAAPPENEPSCMYEATAPKPSYTFVIIPISKMGIQDFLQKNTTYAPVAFSAAGFPAVQIQVPDAPVPGSLEEIDVASGQMVTVQMSADIPGTLTMDAMCAKAQQAAGMAVTTLQQANG